MKKLATAFAVIAVLVGGQASAGSFEDHVFYNVCDGDPVCFVQQMAKAEAKKCIFSVGSDCFGRGHTGRKILERPDEVIEDVLEDVLDDVLDIF